MRKQLWRFSVLLMLTIFVVACGSPMTDGETQPSSAQEVETMVAMTLQALAPDVTDPPPATPEAPRSLLPHTFFIWARMVRGTGRFTALGPMVKLLDNSPMKSPM